MRTQQFVRLPSHEELSRLARNDPPAFETLREALVAGTIDSAPEGVRARLRGMQFQINAVRRLAHSPLGATIKICGLMWESFLRLNDELQDATALVSAYPRLPTAYRSVRQLEPSAKILPFRQRSCVVDAAGQAAFPPAPTEENS